MSANKYRQNTPQKFQLYRLHKTRLSGSISHPALDTLYGNQRYVWRTSSTEQHHVTHSHVTVVRESCKGDDANELENGKFDPLPPLNPLTDRHKKLHT